MLSWSRSQKFARSWEEGWGYAEGSCSAEGIERAMKSRQRRSTKRYITMNFWYLIGGIAHSPDFVGTGGKTAGPSETLASGRCQSHSEWARELRRKQHLKTPSPLHFWFPARTYSPPVGRSLPLLVPCSGTSPPSSPLLSAGGARRTPRPSCRARLAPSRAGSAGPPGTASPPKLSRRLLAEVSERVEANGGAGGAAGLSPWCSHSGWDPRRIKSCS